MDAHTQIELWRTQVDEIDNQIVALLNQRASVVADILARKQAEKLPIRDIKREQQIIHRVIQNNLGPMADAGIAKLLEKIISECTQSALRRGLR